MNNGFFPSQRWNLRATVAAPTLTWWSSSAGVRYHRWQQDESSKPTGFDFQSPVLYVPATVESGNSYSFSTGFAEIPSDGSRPTTFPGLVQGMTRVIGFESVATPAGTFSALKVSVTEVFSVGFFVLQSSTATWWLAQNVGVVKADVNGENWELRSYSIPGSTLAITAHPQSQAASAGATVTFSVTAAGSGPLSYQWKKNSADLPGKTAETLTLANVTLGDAGQYSVAVTNPAGTVTSNGAALTVNPLNPPDRPPRITAWILRPNGDFEFSFEGSTGQSYLIETSANLTDWAASGTLSAVTGSLSFLDLNTRNSSPRFYRVRLGSLEVAAPVATLPEPNRIYPAGTKLGGSLFGAEFTIPPNWKGGLQAGTPLLIFTSDTFPNIAITAALGFAWSRDQFLADPALRGGFESEMGALGKVFFAPIDLANPLKTPSPDHISAEYAGRSLAGFGNSTIVSCVIEIVLHPSSGAIGFLGFATQDKVVNLRNQTRAFADSVRTTPRNTNTEYMNYLNGRSFKWTGGGSDWYRREEGYYPNSASLSSWSQSYGFFCSSGTFEISTTQETYASVTNPSNGFMGISGSTNTREYGQWTIIQSQQYGSLLLMVTLSGYEVAPIKIQADGTLLVGENVLAPAGSFRCQ